MTLHLLALVPATISVCCLAIDRGRARAVELAVELLMLAAMLDSALTHRVLPIWWAAALLAGAVGLVVRRVPRSRRPAAPAHRDGMTTHVALGAIAQAALLLLMMAHSTSPAAYASHHGGGASVLPVLLVAGAGAFVIASACLAVRSRAGLDRSRLGTMGLSVLLMALSVTA